jgi:uroporphyrinogen-III synthase
MTTILVTRPQPDLAVTSAKLLALGIDPLAAPLLRRTVLATELPPAEGFAAMAVSSANALRAMQARDALNGFRALPLFAVGDGTAAEAEMLGFAEIVNAAGDFHDLVAAIAERRPAGPVFYPAGTKRSGDLVAALVPHGVDVAMVEVYDMTAPAALEPDMLQRIAAEADGVLIYSRRTAEAFRSLVAGHLDAAARRRISVLAISAKSAEPLAEAGFAATLVAGRPDDEAMMSLALAFARGQNTA